MIANDQELKVTQGEQQRLPPPLALGITHIFSLRGGDL